jgi:hypothetical protein
MNTRSTPRKDQPYSGYSGHMQFMRKFNEGEVDLDICNFQNTIRLDCPWGWSGGMKITTPRSHGIVFSFWNFWYFLPFNFSVSLFERGLFPSFVSFLSFRGQLLAFSLALVGSCLERGFRFDLLCLLCNTPKNSKYCE